MEPEDLTSATAVDAAVAALAARNSAHLNDMDPEEREEALGHWRELAVEVLGAARNALGGDRPGATDLGRATIVLEDAGGDNVNVSASFVPELEETGNEDEVTGTPAQIAALSLLEALAEEPE
jgi:hypothetical protein